MQHNKKVSRIMHIPRVSTPKAKANISIQEIRVKGFSVFFSPFFFCFLKDVLLVQLPTPSTKVSPLLSPIPNTTATPLFGQRTESLQKKKKKKFFHKYIFLETPPLSTKIEAFFLFLFVAFEIREVNLLFCGACCPQRCVLCIFVLHHNCHQPTMCTISSPQRGVFIYFLNFPLFSTFPI